MKLTAQVQLKPTAEQAAALEKTMRATNGLCNWLSERAWTSKTFRQFDLHKLVYHECRATFPALSSQIIVRAIAKVTDAYKLDRLKRRRFRPLGSVAYDSRILSWGRAVAVGIVNASIWTVAGRQRMPFACGEHQRALLAHDRGESDLALRDGRWYLLVSVDVPDVAEAAVSGWLGVDVGVVNIATTSDGVNYAGAQLNAVRKRHVRLRRKLQKKGTKSAKRLLRRRGRREQAHARHVNHEVSKQIVVRAQRTGRGVAIEALDGIRNRIRASRAQRRVLHSWAFGDLQEKIAYKARRAGVPVCRVDPRNTSRECRVCGHCEKANRRTRDEFACRACGHTEDADVNAARVIASRAAVNRPNAPTMPPGNRVTGVPGVVRCKSRLQSLGSKAPGLRPG